MTKPLGQLLLIGLEESKWTASCERMIRRYQPGGVLLTIQNLREPDRTAEMLWKISGTLDIPPFLALEEEGGTVDPLSAFCPPLPSPHIAASKGVAMVERLGALMGEAFAILGFNLNLAPRLDLANPDVKPSLQPQVFHSDPRSVARCGEAFVMGLGRRQVLACGKYFPGLSGAELEGESALPVVDKPMRALWREDLLPYRELLPQLQLVKVSCAAYKAYDFDLAIPASCSPNVLNGLLRVKLGYRGVAVADFFGAARKLAQWAAGSQGGVGINTWEAFRQGISAGCDIYCTSASVMTIERLALAIGKAVEGGIITAGRIEDAANHIRSAKRGLRRPPAKFSGKAYERLYRKIETFRKEVRDMERANA